MTGPETTTPPDDAATVAAHRAVLVAFALAGLAFATWASRIADVKFVLGLTPGELGTTLLAGSAGSLITLPFSGRVATALGVRRTVQVGVVTVCVALLVFGFGVSVLHSRPAVAITLFLLGAGISIWDVAMNLEGAATERLTGRSVMPRYHAAFSAGTVIAALVGAAMSYGHVPILTHYVVMATVMLGIGIWATGQFLRDEVAEEEEELIEVQQADRSAWTEPRTLLIGVVVLAFAFTEGAANDWLAVAFVDGHHTPRWAGVLALSVFLTFMTIARAMGTSLVDRFGRVRVTQGTAVLSIVGAMAVVFGNLPVAYIGVAVWGVGASLGFPLGMSASADNPRRAAARMSVVATIGYGAFLAGPPLLGHLGDSVGVLRALLVVAAVALASLAAVPALRESSQ